MYYHGLDNQNPFKCAICGQPYVIRGFARDCEATHADDDDD